MTYRSDLSNPFEFNVFGIITGSTVQNFPSIPAQLARLIAYSSNIGSFYVGHQSGTSQCVWELDAGYDTGWFGIDNLSDLWYRAGSGTSDFLAYWIQK